MHTIIGDLIGETIQSIVRSNDELTFTTSDGRRFRFYHDQDCCESVSIKDVVGDLSDLIGSPILTAEERCGDRVDTCGGSETWTFYEFAANRGSVTVSWYGESNGYYSESVSWGWVE